jgi:hypothetical protein
VVSRILFAAALALVLTPSAPAAPVPTHLMPKNPPLAVPTRVGSTWVYERDGQEVTLVVSKVEEKDGARLVTTERVGQDGTRVPHQVVSVSEGGVFLVTNEVGQVYDPPLCLLKLPHREGQAWEVKAGPPGLALGTGRMTAGPVEVVKTGSGTVRAARVELGSSPGGPPVIKATFWYADGVGLVRGDGMVLKSFTPGKE